MTKKKVEAVAYVPLNNTSGVTNITEQQVQQIPNYEDQGVKYQGKYKTQQSQNTYELRAQRPRFYNMLLRNTGAVFDFTFPLVKPQTFYGKVIVLSWYVGSSPYEITIYDDVAANPRFRIYLPLGSGTLVIPCDDCPRSFAGTNILVSITASLAGAEFVNISLLGWDEFS